MSEEVWKPVIAYEKEYQVSNMGRVRSLDRKIIRLVRDKNQRIKKQKVKRKGKMTSLRINASGIVYTTLHHMGVRERCQVSILVAECFLPPPPTRLHRYLRHIDGNKQNNRADNLYWSTRSHTLSNRSRKTGR